MTQDVALRKQLVEEIKKYVQDEKILNAFITIPRHEFVPKFFDRIEVPGEKSQWDFISRSDNEEYWLEQVYKNRPLTTSLTADGRPNSSSSQPNLMAQMIQSLELEPCHRVLEIGTGTGYNAALLAKIVGNSNVVSIDINEALLEAAKYRIERTVGPGVDVIYANGCNIPEELGMFDAIIVTGSHGRIEPSWIRALAPGGRIVFNWAKRNSPARFIMLALEKMTFGLIGRAAPYLGDFMSLHAGAGIIYEPLPNTSSPLELIASDDFRFMCEDPDFGFFLQVQKPSIIYYMYRNPKDEIAYSLHDPNTDHLIRFLPAQLRATPSFWSEIQTLYTEYDALNRPKPQDFLMTVERDGLMHITYDKQ